MTDKQAEALRLADALEELDAQFSFRGLCGEAAAELRRLHEENEQIKRAIRLSGLTLVETVTGMKLTCLGEVEAQGENNE